MERIPFSTLLIYQCPANINRRRVESGKQPTSGSDTQPEPVPIPVKENDERCEWYEWSRSNLNQCQQINIVKSTNGEEQIKPRFEPAPVNKHHHHEWCEWSRTKIKPIPAKVNREWWKFKLIPTQAAKMKRCELCEWNQLNDRVFPVQPKQFSLSTSKCQKEELPDRED